MREIESLLLSFFPFASRDIRQTFRGVEEGGGGRSNNNSFFFVSLSFPRLAVKVADVPSKRKERKEIKVINFSEKLKIEGLHKVFLLSLNSISRKKGEAAAGWEIRFWAPKRQQEFFFFPSLPIPGNRVTRQNSVFSSPSHCRSLPNKCEHNKTEENNISTEISTNKTPKSFRLPNKNSIFFSFSYKTPQNILFSKAPSCVCSTDRHAPNSSFPL